MRRPAFQFYPADWRKDPALSACSMAARGLWIELICIAHESDEYGMLVVNGKPMTHQQIARMVGESPAAVKRLMAELHDAGVYSVDERGAIYSRRMVQDERVRNARAEGGKAGAEHGIKGASHGGKGGRPRKQKAGFSDDEETPLKTPLGHEEKPPPSSSTSVYTTTSTSACAPEPPGDAMPMAADWRPGPGFTALAKLAGVPPAADPDGLGEFVAYWLANPGEHRTQAQWEHALVKSLQARKAQASRPPAAQAKGRSAPKPADRLPAWRIEEIRRQFEATPSLVPAELLHHIDVDPVTRRPYPKPAQGVTIIDANVIDTTVKELPHEPASRLG